MSPPTHIILESLHFRPASPAEKLICWKRNFFSWGGVLNVNDYLGRETVNGSQLVTRDGQITYWVLSSLSSPPADDNVIEETIIAACETLKRPVLVKTRDGGVTEEYSYGIASVFTDPRCRGQGAATVLLKRLAEWLDGEGGCNFSVLFSDVGKEFYATRGGWNPYSSRQIVVTVLPAEVSGDTRPPKSDEKFSTVEYLDRSGVEALCAADVENLRTDYESQGLKEGTYARVTFLPTFAQACWHFGTEDYVAQIVRGKSPEIKGAKVDDMALYWSHDFNTRKLVILRFTFLKPTSDRTIGAAVVLLMAAEKEAREWGFDRIIAWNPSKDIIEAAQTLANDRVEVYDREDDSIPCLRWRGEEDRCIEWQPNEKYAWC